MYCYLLFSHSLLADVAFECASSKLPVQLQSHRLCWAVWPYYRNRRNLLRNTINTRNMVLKLVFASCSISLVRAHSLLLLLPLNVIIHTCIFINIKFILAFGLFYQQIALKFALNFDVMNHRQWFIFNKSHTN